MEVLLQKWVLAKIWDSKNDEDGLFNQTARILDIKPRSLAERFYSPKMQERLTQAAVLQNLCEKLNVPQDNLLVTNMQAA